MSATCPTYHRDCQHDCDSTIFSQIINFATNTLHISTHSLAPDVNYALPVLALDSAPQIAVYGGSVVQSH